jgi:phosphatidylglycerol lysyltransferase
MQRRIIVWLLIIAFLWLVVSRVVEIEQLLKTLAEGQWLWVLVAATLQVGYYIFYTAMYQSAFDTVEVKSRIRDLLPVTFASVFVNVAVPTGGTSGQALFVDDAARRGESPARAAVGTLIALIIDFSAFALVLVIGLIYLFIYHDLKNYEVVTSLILFAMVIGLTGLLILGLQHPERLHRWLTWLVSTVNAWSRSFKRPQLMSESWADKNANELSEAAVAIVAHPGRICRTLAIALAGNVIDLASLYSLFLAFHQPVTLGVLVAGYSIGILFWIVSITPQGIGIVEGMMTLVFTSLGVPAERAAIVSLSFRGLTFWLPLLIGFFVFQRLKTFNNEKPASVKKYINKEKWSIRTIAVLTGIMGVINLLSAVVPSLASRLVLLEQYSPLIIRKGGHLASALSGFALLILASSLWRRKRTAWLLTIIVLVISVVSHLIKGLDYEEAAMAIGLMIWLIYLRPHFHARSDLPSVKQGLLTMLWALVFTLLYGTAGFYLLDKHFSVNFNLEDSLRQTVIMLTQFYDPGLEPITGFGRYFADSIYFIAAVSIGYSLIMIARPVLVRQKVTPEDRHHAQTIVDAHGRSSLARLTLLDDKLYYISPGGTLVAYTVETPVALVLGDPIGPAEDIPTCITNFQELCATNDWRPAFYQVLSDYLEIYHRAGLHSLCIGQEGIVNLAEFTLAGGENKGMRSAVNRLTKMGYLAEVIEPPLSPLILENLRSISDEWLTTVHGTEKRFSLGWFDDDYIRNGQVMAIRNIRGNITAFANIVSEYKLNEVTIDLMRYLRGAEKGTMDFLFVSLFEWAREKGYDSFNLGLSALSGIGESSDDPLVERTLHFIFTHINQFYNFKGLHAFKEKFHPKWEPRYLIYPNPAILPQVSFAIIRADSGNDLLGGYLRHNK